MTTQIRYACDCTSSGYGHAARGNLHALASLGWDRHHVRVVPAVFWKQGAMEAPENDWLKRTYLDAYDDRPDPETGINIVHTHPCYLGLFWSAGWFNIAVTAWETNQLPQQTYPGPAGARDRTVIETLDECYDEVWVPTEAVAEVFRSNGVTTPVFVMPHALLPELIDRPPKTVGPEVPEFHPKAVCGTNGEPGGGSPCRFYTLGTWDLRKDPVRLLQAYYKTGWKIFQPVELLLHATNNSNEQQHDIQDLRAAMPGWADLPSMRPSSGVKSYRWVLDVHEGNHVYVTATHGEGFCLPAVEALAMGNLVVGPRGPLAHLDWAAKAGLAVLVDTEESDIAIMPEHAGYEVGQTWWSASAFGLAGGLCSALELAREGLLPLQEGAEEARKRYSVEALAALMRPRLEAAESALAARSW